MKVAFFHRRAPEGAYSIERLFSTILSCFPNEIEPFLRVCPNYSTGLIPRLINIFWAIGKQEEVNHVTGDIHYITLLLNKRKTILTIHDCAFLYKASGLKKWLLLWFWLKLPVRRVKYVTTISENTKREIIKYTDCNPDKIKVIPNCIPNHFKPFPKSFNQNKPVILQIGTKWNKNIDRLAEALAGISCKLDIVGKLNQETKEILNANRIEYINSYNLSDTEVVEKYHNCDLLAFISVAEGFGMPILEGQAVGRPVITSNISPMRDVANESACLVNPFDVEDMKKGFIKVINDRDYRCQLISKGNNNYRSFKGEHIARQYYDVYQKITKAKKNMNSYNTKLNPLI